MEVGGGELGLRAAEDDEEEPGGVERGQECPDHGDHEEHDPERTTVEGVCDDRVLREEAGERRNSHERQRADQERARGPRELPSEAAHLADVLLVRERMDHEPGRQEEERLEEGVRHQVEETGAIRTQPGRDEHVADLAHRRVRDDALDVRLDEGDQTGDEERDPSEHRRQVKNRRCKLEEDVGTGDQVDAGGHHRGGMDQGRHRGRTLHGVRKPGMERELCRLRHGTAEKPERDQDRDRARGLDDLLR